MNMCHCVLYFYLCTNISTIHLFSTLFTEALNIGNDDPNASINFSVHRILKPFQSALYCSNLRHINTTKKYIINQKVNERNNKDESEHVNIYRWEVRSI